MRVMLCPAMHPQLLRLFEMFHFTLYLPWKLDQNLCSNFTVIDCPLKRTYYQRQHPFLQTFKRETITGCNDKSDIATIPCGQRMDLWISWMATRKPTRSTLRLRQFWRRIMRNGVCERISPVKLLTTIGTSGRDYASTAGQPKGLANRQSYLSRVNPKFIPWTRIGLI